MFNDHNNRLNIIDCRHKYTSFPQKQRFTCSICPFFLNFRFTVIGFFENSAPFSRSPFLCFYIRSSISVCFSFSKHFTSVYLGILKPHHLHRVYISFCLNKNFVYKNPFLKPASFSFAAGKMVFPVNQKKLPPFIK